MRILSVALLLAVLLCMPVRAAEPDAARVAEITAVLQGLDGKLVPEAERQALRESLGNSLREDLRAANRRSTAEWRKLTSADDWQQFRKEKIAALRKSLVLPERPAKPTVLTTGEIRGEGFTIKNLCYVSRPGLVVTANLYVPEPARESMPGIILSHSHHNPKSEGELQDMGMTWARAGCYVLVPDHLGHGERRQHPFITAADYDKEYPISRQDYHFRYDTSLQLYLVGESLMGWLVHDLMTGMDVLLAQPGIDPKRTAILGAVAGGGDPSAVTAAVDERIACLVPFNFGGPQPESRSLTLEEAEEAFNYAGGGSWESTRNLRLSAAEGFLPWVIVGSVAPRHLIHAHEFRWDRETDPVWRRYQTIFGWHKAAANLAFTHGQGTLTSKDPPGSHCNNIGPMHRKAIHEAFRQWFAIDVKPEEEYKNRRTREELYCLTDKSRTELKPQLLHELLSSQAAAQIDAARKQAAPDASLRRKQILQSWADSHGYEPTKSTTAGTVRFTDPNTDGPLYVRRIDFRQDSAAGTPTAVARAIMLYDQQIPDDKRPLVIALASGGAEGFIKHRQTELAELLAAGNAVVLVDVSGTGVFAAGSDHGTGSSETSYSATQMMLGRTLLGQQLRDLKQLMPSFRSRTGIDKTKISVWGDSFAEPLAVGANFKYPRRIDRPAECQPGGPLLALLLALSEEDIAGVYLHRGLVSLSSVLESQFVQVPHGCIVPGSLRGGDLPDLVAALAPRSVRLVGLVDSLNRTVPLAEAERAYAMAAAAYEQAGARDKLKIVAGK